MKTFQNKRTALLVASLVLTSAAGAQTIDNWKSGQGDLVWIRAVPLADPPSCAVWPPRVF